MKGTYVIGLTVSPVTVSAVLAALLFKRRNKKEGENRQ